MTAVIYARYSSDNQREESIEGQIRECTAYAEKNGITVIKHYIDRALSAKTDNRPQFQQMIPDTVFGFRTANVDCTFYDFYCLPDVNDRAIFFNKLRLQSQKFLHTLKKVWRTIQRNALNKS